MEKEILEEASVRPKSLTLADFERILADRAKKDKEIAARLARELKSVLEEYLATVIG